ncbi:hypothetical protein [Pseudomonas amygdali]|uniref:Uncharacterized protein n=2 Tax=Pseudomonas amygdali pv. lachrymans TaxID=53707 RepID=A0ABR5KRR9_PSEAV|nr:hypothetical protein [Pseudomonas amygdali]AXH59998.1 hypothetical protein PLA107_032755 [Pseudomonas amygdali pv. lachrymans str. M301315]KPC17402.1 Uncharacterized protein AC499_0604 [Pseudomonas amygdali pv. lachrymans]RMT06342.1 hypothetical protein ALP54_03855 [Pseudomonas amygdali pv. lachrymans]
MSSVLKHLVSCLGVSAELFEAEPFLSQCLEGKESDYLSVYGVIQSIIGQKTVPALNGVLFALVKSSFETGRQLKLPLLHLLLSASEANAHSRQGLGSQFKAIQNIVNDQGDHLLRRLAPNNLELLAYERLSKSKSPVIVEVIELGLTQHASVFCDGIGLTSPADFRMGYQGDKPVGELIFKSLSKTPLDGSYAEIRSLFLGKNEPSHQETLLRAMTFLNRLITTPKDLPQVPVIKPQILEVFESKILSDVVSEVIEQCRGVLNLERAEVFLEGLKRLSAAGLNLELGVYTQERYGFGIGYLEDQGAPDRIEAIQDSLRHLGYGQVGVSTRPRSNTVHHSMADVFCNHLLDQLPEKQAKSLLTNDAYRLERLRHTGDKSLLGQLENKGHVDRHLAADLGL